MWSGSRRTAGGLQDSSSSWLVCLVFPFPASITFQLTSPVATVFSSFTSLRHRQASSPSSFLTPSAMTSTFTTKLKQFNGTGFPAWGTQVKLVLEFKGLWDAVQLPTPEEADLKAETASVGTSLASGAPQTPDHTAA
ncbi:unnamed protein product [Phytophthora fragariaefolia]|uniref:Unnamed protein product n=1 Tax=Phytophthora fragariaefolia TaxID=1490495 RepID=A0A9W6Y3S5_9STRA|nr:unnamed protein product [Phytophthora fragariaefolia]